MTKKTSTNENPLRQLSAFGQSVWIDYIHRASLSSGEFERLVSEDGVSGVTSNPAIFEEAIAHSNDYHDAICHLARKGNGPTEIYETLAMEDIAAAADALRDVYERSRGRDGYVSLEVSPHLANDTQGTAEEAHRLWHELKRPNVMIKIPGTHAGLPAITHAIAEGINVNATLLFSVAQYYEVAMAYFTGLEQRLARGKPIDRVASVASFFLSRIDATVDKRLETLNRPETLALRGQAAIACARLAYYEYKQLIDTPRWHALAECGATPQRLLWASTSTKNPAYEDTKYVEALIGRDTVNTLPLKTLIAYRDHGKPAPRLEQDLLQAQLLSAALQRYGIDLENVAAELERDGVIRFVEPFDRLLNTVTRHAGEHIA